MADVLAIDFWQCDVTGRCYSHDAIMFATYVFCLADVVAMLLCWMVMFLPSGCCYCLVGRCYSQLVVVGVTTLINSCTRNCAIMFCFVWQMLLPTWLMLLLCFD